MLGETKLNMINLNLKLTCVPLRAGVGKQTRVWEWLSLLRSSINKGWGQTISIIITLNSREKHKNSEYKHKLSTSPARCLLTFY